MTEHNNVSEQDTFIKIFTAKLDRLITNSNLVSLNTTQAHSDYTNERTIITSFKEKIIEAGFDVKEGDSPIVPIMLYDASLSQRFADLLLKEGVYAIGFFYPVVPKGMARIRTQISAAHEKHHLDKAIAAFIKVGKQLKVTS